MGARIGSKQPIRGTWCRVESRRFFSVPASVLAQRLLGCRFVRVLDDGTRLRGVIVETEAYLGVEDRAAHSFGGRRTERNEAMYSHAGTSYVYFTYGMHYCVNVVCGRVNEPTAVLLRALAPDEGVERMALHRGFEVEPGDAKAAAALCRGPGNLCRALSINREQNFIDLTVHPSMWIERIALRKRRVPVAGGLPVDLDPGNVRRGPRIGVESAGEAWAGAALRWYVAGHPAVSGRKAGREGSGGAGKGRARGTGRGVGRTGKG